MFHFVGEKVSYGEIEGRIIGYWVGGNILSTPAGLLFAQTFFTRPPKARTPKPMLRLATLNGRSVA